ncbi:MAG: hypothetical protein ACOY46_18060 [Bacillota bacterium]
MSDEVLDGYIEALAECGAVLAAVKVSPKHIDSKETLLSVVVNNYRLIVFNIA